MDQKKYEYLNIDSTKYKTIFSKKYIDRPKWEIPDKKKITAFLPGTIFKINVKEGQTVKEGTRLCILEAMKMKNRLIAPITGKIKSVNVKEGQNVSKNEILFEFE
ncbi:MAG: acetyl-CoA carboxylase biotin carboxyl carrier protein subunit [Bacteroidia bacterium]|nr:acetyl-CoA carboxylase biotin carboxyl carrier protein subunit [Bacteroidia bacterium]